MFVEELFSLVTFQMYPCNNGNISETWKTLKRIYFWRLTVTDTMILTPPKDMTETLLAIINQMGHDIRDILKLVVDSRTIL
jgi:hypothetical protein